MAVPLERAQSAGLQLDEVKITQKYGGGFRANVEGLHQLHCLVEKEHSRGWLAADVVAESAAEPQVGHVDHVSPLTSP